MFSVEPIYLHGKNVYQPSNLIGEVAASSNLLVPGRVTAASFISQGSITWPIEFENIRESPSVIQISVEKKDRKIDLTKSSKMIWNNDIHWLRLLRIADDCHSYNIQLKLRKIGAISTPKRKRELVLKTVRNIEAGQELILWFSEELLTLMHISFLKPNNIQGQKKYFCLKCNALFESPNPLKIHMVLHCGQKPISSLWIKLSNSLINQDEEKSTKSIKPFTFKLDPTEVHNNQKNALDLTTSCTYEKNESTSTPFYLPFPHRVKVEEISSTGTEQLTSLYLPFSQSIKSEETSSSSGTIFRPFSQPVTLEETSMAEEFKPLYRPFSEPSSSITDSAFKPFIKCEQESSRSSLVCYPTYSESFAKFPNFETSIMPEYSNEAHIETLVSSLGKSKDGHICIYCGKCYSRKYGLKIHIRTHTGYKPLKCKYCSRPFGDPSNLNKHVRLHSEGETPYKCELCGKILVRRRDLERHLKSRHGSEIRPDSSLIPDDTNVSSDDDVIRDIKS